jgi:hypothetical protein
VPLPLKPGSRYRSVTCNNEVVVVKASADPVDLRCGGAPMVPIDDAGGAGPPAEGFNTGTLVGKRYTDEDETIELLVTKPGDGSLSIGETLLNVKGAKPLPSSD